MILILVVARTYVPAKMDVHKGVKDVLRRTASVATRRQVPNLSNARKGLFFQQKKLICSIDVITVIINLLKANS